MPVQPSVQLCLDLDDVPGPLPVFIDQLPAEDRMAVVAMLARLMAKAVAAAEKETTGE
jgi:hypothetical protein